MKTTGQSPGTSSIKRKWRRSKKKMNDLRSKGGSDTQGGGILDIQSPRQRSEKGKGRTNAITGWGWEER